MLRHPDYTRTRITQARDRLLGRFYRAVAAVDSVEVSPRVDRIPYDEAVKLEYRPAKLGEQFGPMFATYWFRIRYTVPRDWKGGRVDLLWDTHGEGTLWVDGRSIEGLNGANDYGRTDAVLHDRAAGGESHEIFIEMSCNDAFGYYGKHWPEHRSPIYLDRCELGLFDAQLWDIAHDLDVLVELEREQVPAIRVADGSDAVSRVAGDLERDWAGTLLFELNRFVNAFDERDRDTWNEAHQILKALLASRNGDLTHHVSAIGHAHIDTAWLWPLAETHRKCVRTFSTQTRYMESYPEYRFACSQAYQYDVVKRINSDLYERIRNAVKKGQWVPVGGTWIEPDCNIPSGESLCRQFLVGQRFFEREFGRRCQEFWNPDVFGYNGQLPQIMRLAGVTRFLTQKLSWNRFNAPLHHTFHWRGIDGSSVLAHFPPADTYNGVCTVRQLRYHVTNYKENDRSREAIYLFGFGDGGCGPTKPMLERLRRYGDLQGVPRTRQRTPDEFFERLERDVKDVPTVVGELYFELHRGTYTTQAKTKRGNRKSEVLLHDVEFLAALAAVTRDEPYPREALDGLWKLLLLNQFHDILPGSSIGDVYRETEADYDRIARQAGDLRDRAAAAVLKPGQDWLAVNTLGVERREVARRPDGRLACVHAPAFGLAAPAAPQGRVTVQQQGDRVTLENDHLRAELHADGRLLSLLHKPTGRQALAPGQAGNVLELSDDRPTKWEAWDVDPYIAETERPCPPADTCRVTLQDPLRAEVTLTRRVGEASTMTQVVRLDAGAHRLEFHCDTDWRESRKMLKVAFGLNVAAMHATYEMQFGAVERPTHYNNTIALAQYEVPGHRWADLSEHGFGVALLSESKYGYSCRDNTLRMSLLRATTMPDPDADRGQQTFSYALYPHAGTWQQGGVVAEGLRFNFPLTWRQGDPADSPLAQPIFRCDDPNLLCDTVKLAEDEDALVLRLYECHGSRGVATLAPGLPFKSAVLCNLLEDDGEPATLRDHAIELPYTPCQIITLKLRF